MQENNIIPALYSKTLSTKSNSYFFDVKEAKNGNKYLAISETRSMKDGKRFRATVTVFDNNLKEFLEVFEDMVNHMK